MKILFYEVRHFSPNFHEFTGSKTIFAKKKKSPFLAQKLERKKVVWTTHCPAHVNVQYSTP